MTLRFAEVLNPDGTIYTDNLRRPAQTDTYMLKGGGEEVFEPRFTFHGFRYVEVTGYPGEPGSTRSPAASSTRPRRRQGPSSARTRWSTSSSRTSSGASAATS